MQIQSWQCVQILLERRRYFIHQDSFLELSRHGTFLAWTQLSDGWIAEGEIKFLLDGVDPCPTISGIPTEHYFRGCYDLPETYSAIYAGIVLNHGGQDRPEKWSLYRRCYMNPICLHEDLRVTIQASDGGRTTDTNRFPTTSHHQHTGIKRDPWQGSQSSRTDGRGDPGGQMTINQKGLLNPLR